MNRWEPDAGGRLYLAAMDLYAEQGFEQTTVTEIAERAGVTERTFFRYFADKREVFFRGQDEFRALFVTPIQSSPPEANPFDAVLASLQAVAQHLEPRRPSSQKRQSVLDATAALQERELTKFDQLSSAMSEALRDRGVAEPVASLAASWGMSLFRVAFLRWVSAENSMTLEQIIAELRDAFQAQLNAS